MNKIYWRCAHGGRNLRRCERPSFGIFRLNNGKLTPRCPEHSFPAEATPEETEQYNRRRLGWIND